VYDENTNDADKILEKAITVTRKYGVKVWILDNLMTIGLNANDTNIYQKQKDFIVKIVGLAKLYNVLIVLVSHPRKTASFQLELTADDVSGSSDITNLAAYLLSVHRFSESEKKGEKDSKGMYKKGKEPILQDVAVDVLKNRYVGKVSRALLYFNYSDYRFYSNPNELFRRYRWNKDTSPLPKIDPNKHIEIPPELGD
jgi:twinkle protein